MLLNSVRLAVSLGYILAVLGAASVFRVPLLLSFGCFVIAGCISACTRSACRKKGIVLPSSNLLSLRPVFFLTFLSLILSAIAAQLIGQSALNLITPHPASFVAICFLIYCAVKDWQYLSQLNLNFANLKQQRERN